MVEGLCIVKEYRMSSPLNNEAPHVPNWLGSQPTNIEFLREKDLIANVSSFHSRIIYNLIEHKGHNNVLRSLVYVIIDIFLEKFWLSRESPEKKKNSLSGVKLKYVNSPYAYYVNYKAFLAQRRMVELAKEKKVSADATLHNLNVDQERIEENNKKQNFIQIVNSKILQNNEELLQKELESIDVKAEDAQEKFRNLLDAYNFNEKWKKAFYEEAPASAIPKVQKVLQENINGYQKELEGAEEKVKKSQRWIFSKAQLKEILKHQIERIKEAAEQLRRSDLTEEQVEKFSAGLLHRNPQTANLQMQQIAANFPFQGLNTELAEAGTMALYPSGNNMDGQALAFERFFSLADSDGISPSEPKKVDVVLQQAIPKVEIKEEKKQELPVIDETSTKEVVETHPDKPKIDVPLPSDEKEKPTDKNNAVGTINKLTTKAKKFFSPKKAEIQNKKLRALLPDFLRDKFGDLPQPEFYTLIGHLTVSLEEYRTIIKKFDLKKLNEESAELLTSFNHFVEKTSSLRDEKQTQEVNSKKEFILAKIEAVEVQIKAQNPLPKK